MSLLFLLLTVADLIKWLHTLDKPCNLYAEMFPGNITFWPSPKN